MAEPSKSDKPKKSNNPVQKMDGKSVSPLNELAELLKTQFPQIFAEGRLKQSYVISPACEIYWKVI